MAYVYLLNFIDIKIFTNEGREPNLSKKYPIKGKRIHPHAHIYESFLVKLVQEASLKIDYISRIGFGGKFFLQEACA